MLPPPSSAGGVNDTCTVEVAGDPTVTPVGAPGTVDGTVMAEVAMDGDDAPAAFPAVARQVYDLPLESPPTVMGDVGPVAVRVVPPSPLVHVAVNPVMGDPLSDGVPKETSVACPEGAEADTPVGMAGTPWQVAEERSAPASRRPPVTVAPATDAVAAAVDMTADRTADGVTEGLDAAQSAMAPVTCGVAMEVPLYDDHVLSGTVDRIPLPGAPRSTVVAP